MRRPLGVRRFVAVAAFATFAAGAASPPAGAANGSARERRAGLVAASVAAVRAMWCDEGPIGCTARQPGSSSYADDAVARDRFGREATGATEAFSIVTNRMGLVAYFYVYDRWTLLAADVQGDNATTIESDAYAIDPFKVPGPGTRAADSALRDDDVDASDRYVADCVSDVRRPHRRRAHVVRRRRLAADRRDGRARDAVRRPWSTVF